VIECPQCGGEFRLTWRLYVRAPVGTMSCPLCGAKLRFTHRWFYWVAIPAAAALVVVPLTLVGFQLQGLGLGAALGIVGGLVIVVPFDKWMESTFAVPVVDRRD
jgi:uncharacterized protein (UPF0212 family)